MKYYCIPGIVIAALFSACTGEKVECGAGTELADGKCVSVLVCGEGTTQDGNKCLAVNAGIKVPNKEVQPTDHQETAAPALPDAEKCKYGKVTTPPDATPLELGSSYVCMLGKDDKDEIKAITEMNPAPRMSLVLADITSYYDKETTFVGWLTVSDSFYFQYRKSQATHYAFDFQMFEDADSDGYELSDVVNTYGPKAQTKDLFTLLGSLPEQGYDNGPILFKVTLTTSTKAGDSSIWTLVRAEPYVDWMQDRCCEKR